MPRYRFQITTGDQIGHMGVSTLADSDGARREAFRLIDHFLSEQVEATLENQRWTVEVIDDRDEIVMSFNVRAVRTRQTMH